MALSAHLEALREKQRENEAAIQALQRSAEPAAHHWTLWSSSLFVRLPSQQSAIPMVLEEQRRTEKQIADAEKELQRVQAIVNELARVW